MSAPEIPNLLSLRGGPRRRGGRGGRGGGSSMGPPKEEPEIGVQRDKLIQQTDTDASISRLSAINAGYLNDKFANEFALDKNPPRRLPIINRGTYVRTTALDRLVESFIRSNAGVKKQIISLGAGTDTRYWRLRDLQIHQELLYHEIDFPSVSTQKLAAIRSSGNLSPPGSSFFVLQKLAPDADPDCARWGFFRDGVKMTEGYLFHPIDLRHMPPKIDNLMPDLPTLLISECCLCYLQPSEARAIISTFARLIPTLGIALYEPTNPASDFGRMMSLNLSARGLQMPTVRVYPSLASQFERLKEAGFVGAQNGADCLWLWQNWVSQDEKDRVARLEMMDEVEEWELLARHYTVVWGYREQGKTRGHFSAWRTQCPGQNLYPPAEVGEELVPTIE